MASKFEATSGKVIGYVRGGSVTQLTSKTTPVTINADCGEILMSTVDNDPPDVTHIFTVNNDRVKSSDVIIVNHVENDTGSFFTMAGNIQDGSFQIAVEDLVTVAGAEPKIRFLVLKANIAPED